MPFKNKEKRKEYLIQYRKNNKEKIAAGQKKYTENNREKRCIASQKYYKTDAGKRVNMISRWKSYDIITDDWYLTYKYYFEHTNCDICDIILTNGCGSSSKCLDHDHSITDDINIRGILCKSCNNRDTSGM